MSFDPEMDKQRLLDLNRMEHDFLRRAIDALPDDRKNQAGTPDDWAVRDILAHVAMWETRFVGWVETAEQGERPDIPAAGFTTAEVDRINAETFAAHHDLPFPEALALFERSFHRFQSKLTSLPEDTLLRPGALPYLNEPLWRYAAANGCDHYHEHAVAIRARIG